MDWPAAERESANAKAAGPRSPMPNGPGSDVGCSSIPLDLGKLTVPVRESQVCRQLGFSTTPADFADRRRPRSSRVRASTHLAERGVVRYRYPAEPALQVYLN